MKKFLLILFPFIVSSGAQAKVLTVSNRPGETPQYTSVSAAIAAAVAGDTIYIQGSDTPYDSFTLNKRLTLIGPGHNPNKELPLVVNVLQLMIDGENAAASGSSIIGLTITELRCEYNGQKAITIKRCRIKSYISAAVVFGQSLNTEWIIENNIISSLFVTTGAASSNFIIRNNIFTGTIKTANTCVISNNNFIGGQAFGQVNNAIIENNIFYGSTPLGAINSTFNNNITFSSEHTVLPYGSNNGNANKVNVDPKFTAYTGGDFSYDHDYHLQESSPGIKAGTNGTDIGIYGGMGFSETGEPPIPVVRSFLIQNGILAPNGKLKIIISAEAKN